MLWHVEIVIANFYQCNAMHISYLLKGCIYSMSNAAHTEDKDGYISRWDFFSAVPCHGCSCHFPSRRTALTMTWKEKQRERERSSCCVIMWMVYVYIPCFVDWLITYHHFEELTTNIRTPKLAYLLFCWLSTSQAMSISGYTSTSLLLGWLVGTL